jgi:hypothetical protein
MAKSIISSALLFISELAFISTDITALLKDSDIRDSSLLAASSFSD